VAVLTGGSGSFEPDSEHGLLFGKVVRDFDSLMKVARGWRPWLPRWEGGKPFGNVFPCFCRIEISGDGEAEVACVDVISVIEGKRVLVEICQTFCAAERIESVASRAVAGIAECSHGCMQWVLLRLLQSGKLAGLFASDGFLR